jgi:predicted lipopolysaccharide heptosyltransferase III
LVAPNRILLVRLRLLGDVVFTTPLISALRRRFPLAHLAYVVEPLAAPIVAGSPHLNAVLVAPRSQGMARWRDDWSLGARLRNERFDIAVDLHGGPRAAWLTWASRARMRIGYRTAGRTWMYTHPVERPADLTARHSVDKQWDLLAPLGFGSADRARDPVEMPADAAADSRVAEQLARAGISHENPLVVVHVSAGNPFRRWPQESFAEMVIQLAQRDPRRRFILTSGPSEADAAQNIIQRVADRSPETATLVTHGHFEVAELRSLVVRAAVYIGGDSGPMHIAATTKSPIVALFGPTLAPRSMPWRDDRWFSEAVDAGTLPCRPCRQRTCAPGDFRCLTTIPAAQVVAAAERALAASSHESPEPTRAVEA